VARSPDRPFIPHRTPKSAMQPVSSSEFRLPRPFVPGAERATFGAFHGEPASRPVAESSRALRPIEDFLDLSEPKAEGAALQSKEDVFPFELEQQFDELPPLEHFLDPLPPIAEFAPDAAEALVDESVAAEAYSSESATASAAVETGWVEDDWQRYDWRAAAALGDGVEAEASQEWATTDWDSRLPRSVGDKPSPAQAIANALDQIAQQIREGGLAVPPSGGATDPAAIAATLAALLGVRR
jgi:hypothetical protein